MRCDIIVNPIVKLGRALSHAKRAQRHLQETGWQCEILPSISADHVQQLTAEAIKRGVDAIAIIGGDGTIHHAVQVLAYIGIPLGIIPCGRGNDLARALGIPLDTQAAAAIIVQGQTRVIDLGFVQNPALGAETQRYFCGIVTCGFDSEVADFAHRHYQIPGGWIGYFGAALLLLARYRFREVRLKGNGFEFTGKVLLSATANCPAYGGGMWLAPTAKLDDGLLHLCIVRKTSKLRILRLFPMVFTGEHIREPEVSLHPVKRLTIDANETLPLFADGEPVGATPAEIKIAPNALSVFVPKEV